MDWIRRWVLTRLPLACVWIFTSVRWVCGLRFIWSLGEFSQPSRFKKKKTLITVNLHLADWWNDCNGSLCVSSAHSLIAAHPQFSLNGFHSQVYLCFNKPLQESFTRTKKKKRRYFCQHLLTLVSFKTQMFFTFHATQKEIFWIDMHRLQFSWLIPNFRFFFCKCDLPIQIFLQRTIIDSWYKQKSTFHQCNILFS